MLAYQGKNVKKKAMIIFEKKDVQKSLKNKIMKFSRMICFCLIVLDSVSHSIMKEKY